MSSIELAGGSNRHFHHQARTTASPDDVWSVWMDVSSWKHWDGGLADAEGSVSDLGATGVVIDRSRRRSPFEVTEYEEGQVHAFSTKLPGGALVVRRSIIGTGPTCFRHEVRFIGIGGLLFSQLLGRGFRRALPPTMKAVAQQAEGASS